MTDQIQQARRAAFESLWPMPDNCIRCGKTYAATSYNAWSADAFIKRWEGFNAALDSLCIELPHDVSHVTCPPFEEGRDAVLAAIEQTNMGIKIK